MWRWIPLLVFALAACAPRGPVLVTPSADSTASIRPVYVATTRGSDINGPGAERAEQAQFARYDVRVPPKRAPGSISIQTYNVDPDRDFTAQSVTPYGSLVDMRRALTRALRAKPPGSREVMIYVHGFNNTFAEGLYRVAQLEQDLDLETLGVHYSWPSAGNPLGYGYDRDSMLFARDGFEALVNEIAKAGAERVVLVAHSLGSLLAMETMRQMAIRDPGSPTRKIDGVVLISPDIDIDVFEAQARRIGTLPDPFLIFTSRRDRALRLSARLTGQRERLGNLSDPEALARYNVTLLDVTEFSSGLGHFTAGTSPALLSILGQVADLDAAFQRDRAGRAGLFPGTVLTVQNATQVILSPLTPRAP